MKLISLILLVGALSAQQVDYRTQVKNKPVLSVKDPPYNAKGNGIADDTIPIQNAFDAAVARSGVVYFPSGTYNTSGIEISNGSNQVHVSILGESGYGATKIVCTGAATAAIHVVNDTNFSFQNFLVEGLGGNCTNGILFTSSAFGTGTHHGTITNVQAGNFPNGAGIKLGEDAGGKSASEMTFITTYIYNSKYGFRLESANTANITLINPSIQAADEGVSYLGDVNFAGFPINVVGGSNSANKIDYKLYNPCTLSLTNVLSEGKTGTQVYGQFLETGVFGQTPGSNFKVSINGAIAIHDYSMLNLKSIVLNAPTNLSIRDSVIGNGYIYLSGGNNTRFGNVIVDNSAIWYFAAAPVGPYFNGGDYPFIYDGGSISNWNIITRGSTSDVGNGITPLVDETFSFVSGGTRTDHQINAPTGVRVHSIPADIVNDAPRYGLGYTNIATGGGFLTQVAGYYGIILESMSNRVWSVFGASGTTNRWAIGYDYTSAPVIISRLDVKGAGTTGATLNTILKNSVGTSLFEVYDDASMYIKGAVNVLGLPGINLTCAAGKALQGVIITNGIITAGTCQP